MPEYKLKPISTLQPAFVDMEIRKMMQKKGVKKQGRFGTEGGHTEPCKKPLEITWDVKRNLEIKWAGFPSSPHFIFRIVS